LPWWPDFQVRLARNDATLGVRGGLHGGIVPALPARHTEEPIYHLDALVRSEDQRRAKATGYEAFEPGPTAYGGGRLNDVLYLPERQHVEDLRPVPVADRVWIDQVLTARAPMQRRLAGYGRTVEIASAEEIDALAPLSSLPETAYRAALSLFDDGDRRMLPDELRPMYVRVENQSALTLPWGFEQSPSVRVSYHWRTPTGEIVEYDGIRSPLTAPLEPGDTQIVPVWVRAPAREGRYLLEFDLVHELVRWFDVPVSLPVVVHPGRSAVRAAPSTPATGEVH
jgi:hypothetical protein